MQILVAHSDQPNKNLLGERDADGPMTFVITVDELKHDPGAALLAVPKWGFCLSVVSMCHRSPLLRRTGAEILPLLPLPSHADYRLRV